MILTTTNAEIAKYYKINKSTVARIRKIYEDVRFKKINPESVAILAKRNHVSKNTILAIAGKAKGVKRFY